MENPISGHNHPAGGSDGDAFGVHVERMQGRSGRPTESTRIIQVAVAPWTGRFTCQKNTVPPKLQLLVPPTPFHSPTPTCPTSELGR
eukprot:754811-Hanusia_phi.AAC.2